MEAYLDRFPYLGLVFGHHGEASGKVPDVLRAMASVGVRCGKLAHLGGRIPDQRAGIITQWLMRRVAVCAHKARAKFMLSRLDFVESDGVQGALARHGRLQAARSLVVDEAEASVYGSRPDSTPLLP